MISALRHGPVSRTYEEEDEDEQTLSFVDPDDALEFHIAPDILTADTIFFSLTFAAKPITDALIVAYDLESVGHVKYCAGKVTLADVYYSKSKRCLVVLARTKVEDNVAPAFASLFDRFKTRAIAVVDSFGIANYVGQSQEGSLRKIVTSSIDSHEVFAGSAFVASTMKLEVGNLVTGLAAAILSHAEARQIPAVAFLALSKVYVSVAVMKAFEPIAPLLQGLFVGERITLPTNATYNEHLKRDPYVLRTENLYS